MHSYGKNKYPQRRETWQASDSLKHKPDSNKSFDHIPVLYKVLPSFLWSVWEYFGMETDSHITHFAASTYQIGLLLQVQNHLPTKCRAAAPARALGSTHHVLVSPCTQTLFLHCSATLCMPRQLPALLLVRRDVLPIPQSHHQLSSASFSITLQQVEFASPDPAKHLSKQLKLTETRACALILQHWIGYNRRPSGQWVVFFLIPVYHLLAHLILTSTSSLYR